VHLVYADDSTHEPDYQMMGAIIMPDTDFRAIEEYLAYLVEFLVPEGEQSSFEFHASALFHAKPPFDKVDREKVLHILDLCASIGDIVAMVYGAVNTRKLRSSIFATANPIDISFRICLEGIEKWFTEKAPNQIGILICDETKQHRDALRKAFRAYRRQLKSEKHTRGMLEHLHDDMYFGDSSQSIGIQLADIWSFIVMRHLQQMEDTEYLYRKIEPHIFFSKIEFEDGP